MNDKNPVFNVVEATFAKEAYRVFEARDLFERRVVSLLVEIGGKLQLQEWEWYGESYGFSTKKSKGTIEEIRDECPNFIDTFSRIYRYRYSKGRGHKKQYFAAVAIGHVPENQNQPREVRDEFQLFCFIRSDDEKYNDELHNLCSGLGFEARVEHDGKVDMVFGKPLSLDDLTMQQATSHVREFLKVWDKFQDKK